MKLNRMPLILGAVFLSNFLAFSSDVDVSAWCTVNKIDGTVQCEYNTKDDCETYRQVDETCVQNPEPGKQY